MFFPFLIKKPKNKESPGFSLIELMVTITIVTLVTGITMMEYSSFNSIVLLKSQAYELALDMRSAQVSGVSPGGGTNSYREAYGIYIDLANPNEYLLFQDVLTSSNLRFDDGEAIGETYTIDTRFRILEICTTVASTRTCMGTGGTNASVAFKRPDFDARMWSTIDSSPDVLEIVIASANDSSLFRTVSVYASGQISVQ